MPDEHFTLLGYEIKIIIKVKHSHDLELNLKCGERRTTHDRTVFKKRGTTTWFVYFRFILDYFP